MNIKVLLHLTVASLLFTAPLFAMELSSETDEETHSDSELNIDEQSNSHWIGSFFSSQVAGAHQLLRYGRHAAEDLINVYETSTETDIVKPPLQVNKELLALFLRDKGAYDAVVRCLPREMKRLLARSVLERTPSREIIRAQLSKGCCLHLLVGHNTLISAQFNAAGDRIATNSDNGTVQIWDTVSGACLHDLQHSHRQHIMSLQFNGAGDKVVTASFDGTAKIWDVESGRCLHSLEHTSEVNSAKFSKSGDRIVTTSLLNIVKIWHVESGQLLATLQGRSAEFNGVGDRIVTVTVDGTAKIWDAASGVCLHNLQDHTREIMSARFNGAGNKVITISNVNTIDDVIRGSTDARVKIWDAESGRCLLTLVHNCAWLAQFNETGDRIITASVDGTVKIWDAASGESLHTLKGHGSCVNIARFNVAGDRIITGCSDGIVKIWEVASGHCLYTLRANSFVTAAEFDTAGDRIITASSNVAKIWDVGSLFAASRWLERECTLEQALLLHCIFKTRTVGLGLKKKLEMNLDTRFDFDTFPHLQEHFLTMPALVQKCLLPFVKFQLSQTTV